MSNQPRVVKVLAALLVSMTAGTAVLMALSGRPPVAGPFSLASYVSLPPIKDAVHSGVAQQGEGWNSIEVYFSGSRAGNIEQLAALYGLSRAVDINCHFVVCNGLGGGDGQVLSTAKWQRQLPIIPARPRQGQSRTIRMCVIAVAESPNTMPTEYQVQRVYALTDKLCHSFGINPRAIRYPPNWQ